MKAKKDKFAVIFDMDGVLVDSYEPHYLSWVKTCKARGIPFSRRSFKKLFGRPFKFFAKTLSPGPLTETEIEEWYRDKETLYREIIESDFPEIDGAGDLIKDLHDAGIVIGVASSGPRENVEHLLRRLTHAKCVSAWVSAHETSRHKPHPEPFHKCAKKLGVSPARCIVIEDSIHGLQAGRSAGMATIALAGTSSAGQLADFADLVVTSLRQLNAAVIRDIIASRAPGRRSCRGAACGTRSSTKRRAATSAVPNSRS